MIKSHYLYFFKQYLNNRLFNKKQPLLASFKITYKCNLQCRVCPFWKMPDQSISYDQAISIMNTLYDSGVRLIIFEGGEPSLWHDADKTLKDLLIYANNKFFSTGITSNGLMPLNTSADTIWISIDGLKKTHEANRGKSFDRIIHNIKTSSHPNLLANITITSLNYEEIGDLVKFLSSLLKGITVQFYYPFPGTENLALSNDDRIKVLNQLIGLKKQGYPVLDSYATLNDLKYNNWHCHSWLIASANPDGRIDFGCYLKNRADISCKKCGFAAHAEISKALDLNWEAIRVGHRVFKFRLV